MKTNIFNTVKYGAGSYLLFFKALPIGLELLFISGTFIFAAAAMCALAAMWNMGSAFYLAAKLTAETTGKELDQIRHTLANTTISGLRAGART